MPATTRAGEERLVGSAPTSACPRSCSSGARSLPTCSRTVTSTRSMPSSTRTKVRRQRARARGDIYWSMALRATQATLRGDLPVAEQLARGAMLRGRELEHNVLGAEFLQSFVIRYQQGRLGEFVGGLRATVDDQPAYRAGSALAALACAETGHVEEGARRARWAVGRAGDMIQKDALWLGAHALFCGVAARAGDADLAETLYEILEPSGADRRLRRRRCGPRPGALLAWPGGRDRCGLRSGRWPSHRGHRRRRPAACSVLGRGGSVRSGSAARPARAARRCCSRRGADRRGARNGATARVRPAPRTGGTSLTGELPALCGGFAPAQ